MRSDDDSYLFIGQDKYYTAGTFLNFSYLIREGETRKTIQSWELGQMIYTSYAGNVPDPQRQDRPFAGYDYIQGSRTYLYSNGQVLKLSMALGALGPQSDAEQVQLFVHRLFHLYKPSGWQYQVQNELGVQLQADYNLSFVKSSDKTLELSMNNHTSLSNIFCNAATGVLLRAGRFNDFANSGFFGGGNLSRKTVFRNELFFYSKLMANYIAYDATIEGGYFDKSSPIVFKQKPFVIAEELGCQYTHQRWGLSYCMTFKTREVESAAKPDQYASIHVSYRFN